MIILPITVSTATLKKEIFEAINIEIQIKATVNVVPKSGCLKIKKSTGELIKKLLNIFLQDGKFLLQKSAKSKINNGLANSDG